MQLSVEFEHDTPPATIVFYVKMPGFCLTYRMGTVNNIDVSEWVEMLRCYVENEEMSVISDDNESGDNDVSISATVDMVGMRFEMSCGTFKTRGDMSVELDREQYGDQIVSCLETIIAYYDGMSVHDQEE